MLKFLLGARAVDPFIEKAANEVIGLVMYEKVCRFHPELKSDDPNYLTNEYLNEETSKIFQGKQKELLKIQERVQQELQKLLK